MLFARRKPEAKGQVSEYKTLIIDNAPLSFGLMFSQQGTLHGSCKTWKLVKSAQLCSNMRLMNRTDSPSALLVIIGPQVWRHGWGDEHGRCLDSKPWFCNSKNQLARRLSERPITKPGQSTDRSTFNLMHQAEQQGKVGLSCTMLHWCHDHGS